MLRVKERNILARLKANSGIHLTNTDLKKQ